ncbi:hypothetical protein GCM10009632_41530 [Mycolicibacterium alvei]|jgi:hypothetical protein
MDSNIEFSGVAAAGMPSSVLAVAAAPSAAAWPAAAAIAPQHKRRPAAATGASVDRSPF